MLHIVGERKRQGWLRLCLARGQPWGVHMKYSNLYTIAALDIYIIYIKYSNSTCCTIAVQHIIHIIMLYYMCMFMSTLPVTYTKNCLLR